ncbi:MAG: chemotaxis protein CheD [Pseudomonadota bacterium]
MNTTPAKERSVLVAQGEFEVASEPNVVLSTLLGSCVAACIWDPDLGIGGMNHIVLPERAGGRVSDNFAGVNAMELLINGIIKQGGRRPHLQAKLFGGASMIAGLSTVGVRNAEFATEFLEREGIPCLSTSLGGDAGRRVQFWPATGRARQKLMPKDTAIEEPMAPAPQASAGGDDIELF